MLQGGKEIRVGNLISRKEIIFCSETGKLLEVCTWPLARVIWADNNQKKR